MSSAITGETTLYEVDQTAFEDTAGAETLASGVSWAAIIAGAFAAAALSLILFSLGAGFGLISVSPWSNAGASATAIGVTAIIWLIVTQWLSAAAGGYLAGRLRTKWVGLHSHEVFFRDTAHGFLAWAVGVVISAALLSSALSSLVGGTAQLGVAAMSAGQSTAQTASPGAGALADPTAYYVDALFRTEKPAADVGEARGEAARIMAAGLRSGDLAPADKTYLAQLVAARSGLAPPDAQKRVDDVFGQAKAAATEAANKAREAADAARKAGATLAFATCIALLIGAFIASAAGALGGSLRDESQGAEMIR